jgi:hypothetical protein
MRLISSPPCRRNGLSGGAVPSSQQSQHLSVIAVGILRQFAGRGSCGHKQRSIACECDMRSPEHGAPVTHEKIAHIAERRAFELAARQRGCALPVLAGLAVCKVEQLVFGKLRMQRDIEQTGVAQRVYLRDSRRGLAIANAVANDAKPRATTTTLILCFSGVERERSCRQSNGRNADRFGLLRASSGQCREERYRFHFQSCSSILKTRRFTQ